MISWFGAVSCKPRLPDDPTADCYQFELKRDGRQTPCRFLRVDDLPEYGPDPGSGIGSRGCLHCWGIAPVKPEFYDKRLTTIKDHLALSWASSLCYARATTF